MGKIVSAEAIAKVREALDATIVHYKECYREDDEFTVKTVIAILRSLKVDLLEE